MDNLVEYYFFVTEYPVGTTFKVDGNSVNVETVVNPDGTTSRRVPLANLPIPQQPTQNNPAVGIPVEVQLPKGAYPDGPGQEPISYPLSVVVDPDSIQVAGFKNNGNGDEPGRLKPREFDTYDAQTGAQMGATDPNNDWITLTWKYKEQEAA